LRRSTDSCSEKKKASQKKQTDNWRREATKGAENHRDIIILRVKALELRVTEKKGGAAKKERTYIVPMSHFRQIGGRGPDPVRWGA